MLLGQWEGVVTEIGASTFWAIIRDLREDRPDDEAEFYTSEVSRDDEALLVPGATFYWTIGLVDRRGYRRRRFSELRLRRLPLWGQDEQDQALDEANALARIFDNA